MLSRSTPYLNDILQALIDLLPIPLASTARTKLMSTLITFCANKSLKALLIDEYDIISVLVLIVPSLQDQPLNTVSLFIRIY